MFLSRVSISSTFSDIVFDEMSTENLPTLLEVLRRLADTGIRLNKSKCFFPGRRSYIQICGQQKWYSSMSEKDGGHRASPSTQKCNRTEIISGTTICLWKVFEEPVLIACSSASTVEEGGKVETDRTRT